MATTQQDVKLVYGGLAGDITATPPGSALVAPIGSGVPSFQGVVTPPPVNLALDFNDGLNNSTLGIWIAGEQDASQLPYRKHTWFPTGGHDGLGYINMHWQTDMNIQFSPVSINIPAPAPRHFRLLYYVRQSAQMFVPGSNVKVIRMRFGESFPVKVGTLLSGSGNNLGIRWTWEEDWRALDTQNFNVLFPSDSLWHLYDFEYDVRDINALTIKLAIDGVQQGQSIRSATLGDQWSNTLPLTLSIFAEMYSCGLSGCQSQINTGDYDVDTFSFIDLT